MPRAAAAAAYAAMILADNPLAYWRCSDAASPIKDMIGGLAAGATSAPLLLQAGALPGDSDMAIASGASGYFDAGNAGGLAFAGAQAHSFECWLYPTTVDASNRCPISFRGGGTNGWTFWLKNTVPYTGVEGFNAGLVRGAYNSDFVPQANQWMHFVFAFDGTTGRVYINGKLTGANGGNQAIAAGNDLRFMSDAGGLTNFLGSMDEIAFYPAALSAQRILQHYQAGLAIQRAGVNYRSLILGDGPLGYWRMDDAASPFLDAAGSVGAATGFGAGGSFQQPGGIADGDTAFTNSSGAYGQIVGSKATVLTDLAGLYSLEAWFKTTDASALYHGIISKDKVCGLLVNTGNLVTFDWSLSLIRDTGINVADGKWHHAVLVQRSGVAGGTQIYLDGVLVMTTIVTPAAAQLTFADLSLGNNNSQVFVGSIDELAAYTYLLSAQQVRQHYLTGLRGKGSRVAGSYANIIKGDGAVGYWRLNEPSGTNAADSAGANPGTLQFGGLALGKPAAAGLLDGGSCEGKGTVGAINCGSNLYAFLQSKDFSFETWAMFYTLDDAYQPLAACGTTSADQFFNLDRLAKVLHFGLWTEQVDGVTPLTPNVWWHLACTYRAATKQITLYVNGVQDGQGTPVGALNVNTGAAFFLMQFWGDSSNATNGRMAEAALFDRVLTAKQILDHYTAGTAFRRALTAGRSQAA